MSATSKSEKPLYVVDAEIVIKRPGSDRRIILRPQDAPITEIVCDLVDLEIEEPLLNYLRTTDSKWAPSGPTVLEYDSTRRKLRIREDGRSKPVRE